MGLLFSLLIAGFLALLFDPQQEILGFDQKQVEANLKRILISDELKNRVDKALLDEDLELAQGYLDLVQSLGLPVDEVLQQKVEAESGLLINGYRQGKAFGRGFLFGEGNSSAALVGSVSADFTVVGDVRDFSIETVHYLSGDAVDYLSASLSALGVALSAGTVLSLGAASEVTLPSKLAISSLKFGKKNAVFSERFLTVLKMWSVKAVDLEPLLKYKATIKGTDYFKPEVWREFSLLAKRSVKQKEVDRVLQPLVVIQEGVGEVAYSLEVIRYADSVEDLKPLSRLSKTFGKRSVVVLKTLGRGALKISRRAWKWFLVLFTLVAGGVYSFMTFGGAYFLKRRILG